jgi:hypothetical protein
MLFEILMVHESKFDCLFICRRLTIDLEQPEKSATLVDLMKDNSSYVQAELPRVNPAHKGRAYR